jgi:putative transposase
VGDGKGNVAGRYPSKKMRVTIRFESHRVELAAVYELEHDGDVLEYYDQPSTFKLDYRGATGRHLGVLHTADLFVIRQKAAGWEEECKTHEELVQLAQRNENRYQPADGRGWRCPPGETYARLMPSGWVCTTEFALPAISTGSFNGIFSSLRITFAARLQSVRSRVRP